MFNFMANQSTKSVIILTDRLELHEQAGKNLTNPNAKVMMAQTLQRRADYSEIKQADLIIIDEAHKTAFDFVFEHIPENTYVIGVTATPYRDGQQRSLDEFYTDLIQLVDTPDLIMIQKLSKPKTYGMDVKVEGMRKGREFDEEAVGRYYNEEKVYFDVLDHYQRLTPNSKAIIFASSREASMLLVSEWQQKGLPIKHVDCYMSDRDEVIKWFRETPNAILSNYGILTTGFDVPNIKTVILYRATTSLTLYLQMVGRGSRVTPYKSEFTILDFGNNVKRHGYWEQPRTWSLRKREKPEGAAPIKECPKCAYLMFATVQECPECGYDFPKSAEQKRKERLEELKLLPGVDLQKIIQQGKIQDLMDIAEAKEYHKRWIIHQLKTDEQKQEYGKIKGYKKGWDKVGG